MSRRSAVFFALCVVAALGFMRLGFWQLARLRERRARNEVIASRLDSASVPFERLPRSASLSRFRRVTLRGTYDYAHELVLAGRTHSGSPGVELLTPLRRADTDTVVLVNRGWVYSPDAATIAAARWREADTTRVVRGFIGVFPQSSSGPSRLGDRSRALRWLDSAAVRREVGAPIASVYVVAQGSDTLRRDSTPVRLKPPPLDEGPHRDYAIQWFAFAAIAAAGAAIAARRGM